MHPRHIRNPQPTAPARNPYFFHPPAAHYVPGILHAPPYHTAQPYMKPLGEPVPNAGFNLPDTVHFGLMPSDQACV